MTTTTDPKPYKLTDDQRSTLEQLIAIQSEMKRPDGGDLGNEDFAKRHLKFAGSTWSLMRDAIKDGSDGGYFRMIKRPESQFIKLKHALRMLRRRRAIASGAASGFHNFLPFEAAQLAIDEAAERNDANRLVFFLAPTGGGKSTLCKQIAARDNGYVIDARQSWRTSSFTAIKDIARELGVDVSNLWTPDAIEDAVMLQCRTLGNAVLAIDEGKFFGPKTLELLIWLLNNTTLVILVCTPREYYEYWVSRYKSEAAQVIRRTHAAVEADEINAEDAETMLKGCGLNGDLHEAAVLAREAANTFGRFDFLARLADRLKDDRSPTLRHVKLAITSVRASMRVQDLMPGKPAKK